MQAEEIVTIDVPVEYYEDATARGKGLAIFASAGLPYGMPPAVAAIDPSAPPRPNRAQAVIEIVLIWFVFAIHAGWLPPDPNEPHYLSKAKHYWNPSWCANDFFLESDDTHLVFYVAAGWLTKLMPLDEVAWCGRLVTWGLMAWGWRRLSWSVVPQRGWAVLSAALFVALNEHFQMAGEWVVGGFEAKGFAYALVFFALAEVVQNRWNRAWLMLGAASAFHVLVGGWSAIAASVAWFLSGKDRPPLRAMAPAMVVGAILALPGVLPALALSHRVDPAVQGEANRLYVFQRLPHHLTPMGMKTVFIERHALLLCVFVMLCAFTPRDELQRRLRGFVIGAIAISLAGFAISLIFAHDPTTAAGLLRFYWFRLSDAVLPMGVALVGVTAMTICRADRSVCSRVCQAAAIGLVAWHLGSMLLVHLTALNGAEVPRADAPGKVWDYHDWRVACQWISDHTPDDALFLTPRSSQTFKWYANRSEVVTWKDIPQNADQLVDWWHRMRDVFGTGALPPEKQWYNTVADRGTEEVRQLAEKYDADYVLTSSEPRLELERVYENRSYALYKVK